MLSKNSLKKIKRIKLVVFDVDGVLTDGRITIGPDGKEGKTFMAKDGIRMSLAARAGIYVCFFTGRPSRSIKQRAKNTDVAAIWYKSDIRGDLFDRIREKFGVSRDEVAYVGDDLIDLGFMRKAGFSVSPADGAAEVRKSADYVTSSRGGEGVAAEVIELILKAQGSWENLVKKVTDDFRLLA